MVLWYIKYFRLHVNNKNRKFPIKFIMNLIYVGKHHKTLTNKTLSSSTIRVMVLEIFSNSLILIANLQSKGVDD